MKSKQFFQRSILFLLIHICCFSTAQNNSTKATHPASAVIKYVTPSGAGLKDGSSWGDAIDTLGFRTALDFSLHATEFWVAAGMYKPTYGTIQTITFQINDSVKVYGGFNGTETLLSCMKREIKSRSKTKGVNSITP